MTTSTLTRKTSAPPKKEAAEPVVVTHSALLDALPFACWLVDKELRILSTNSVAEEWVGAGAKRMRGTSLDFWLRDDALPSLIARVIDTGNAVYEYVHNLPLSQGEKRVHLRALPFDVQKKHVLLLAEALEHAELLAQEEEAKRVVKAAGLSAAMLAHEVKNPLAGIRGAAQLLQTDVSEENKPLAALIVNEVDRIRDLLDGVEYFAEKVAPATEAVNIHEVLHHACQLAKAGFAEKISFREYFDPSLPPVSAHRSLLVQLFLNLLKNAAEALPLATKPTIQLHTSMAVQAVREAGKTTQRFITVEIEDNGSGVPKPLRDSLFSPFASTRGSGRGLGLAIVAKIAADFGGKVELIESREGCTRFGVLLPVA